MASRVEEWSPGTVVQARGSGGLCQGKTYCFGSKEAMAEFMKNPKDNLAKAQTYYSKKHPS